MLHKSLPNFKGLSKNLHNKAFLLPKVVLAVCVISYILQHIQSDCGFYFVDNLVFGFTYTCMICV